MWQLIFIIPMVIFLSILGFETYGGYRTGKKAKQLKVKHEALMLDNSLRVQKRRRRSQEKLAWEVAYRKALEETHDDYIGMLNYLSPNELRHYWENE